MPKPRLRVANVFLFCILSCADCSRWSGPTTTNFLLLVCFLNLVVWNYLVGALPYSVHMFDYLISSTRPRKRKLKNSMQNGKYVQFLEMDSPGPATEGMHKGFVGHNAGN